MKRCKLKTFILIIIMIFIGILYIPKGRNIIIQNKDYKNSNELEDTGIKKISQVNVGTLELLPSEDGGEVTINLNNSDYQDGTIKFAVWSAGHSQSDLKWYKAEKKNTTYTLKLKDFKYFGLYYVDAYYESAKGESKFLIGDTFTIDAPQVDKSISEIQYDPSTDAVNIKIKLNTSLNITKVTVPMWSNYNGQDDLIWYEANDNDKDGIWTVNTNLSRHTYFVGKYIAHIYVTTSSGIYACLDQLSKDIYPNNRLTSSVNEEQSGFNIVYNNYPKLKGYEFSCAVWSSANGQDDLVWYDVKNGNLSSVFSNHLNKNDVADSGLYYADLYIRKNGNLYYLDSTTFTVDDPKVTSVEATQVGDTIEVYVKNVSSNVKKVEIPVWSIVNDQDDIKWYKATNLGNGTWKCSVKIKDHKYSEGIYMTHTYLYYGNKTQIIGKSCLVNIDKGNVNVEVDPTETKARVTLNDGVYKDNIKFAVWSSANGQDDLVWYNAKKDGNGVPYFDVPIINHKQSGLYYVDVYFGNKWLVGTTFTISPIEFNASITDIDPTDEAGDGIYKVIVNSKSDISNVQVAVWSTSNQNDLKWYNATLEGENYVVTVNPKYHKYNNGNYHTHIYVTGKNGVCTGVAEEDVLINLQISARVEGTNRANTTVRIYNTPPSISKVQLPTWSVDNGTDDVVWYQGKKQSDGSYIAIVKSSDHPPFDSNNNSYLASDIYVNDGKVSKDPLYFTIRKFYFDIPDRYRYSQKNPDWRDIPYGLGTLGRTGCMPTSLAMAFSSIYDRNIFPYEVASYLYNRTNEYNKIGPGTTGYSVVYAASYYGTSYKGLGSLEDVRKALKNGQIVIGALAYEPLGFGAPGSTHAVAIYGYDGLDRTNVIDPLDFVKTGIYRVEDLFNQRSHDPDDTKAGGVSFHALY